MRSSKPSLKWFILAPAFAAGVYLVIGSSGGARSGFAGAVDFVRHCSSERHVREHEVFLSIVGEKKPSDWLEFFLSPLGTGTWMTKSELDEIGGHGAVLTCPLAPEDVIIISGAHGSNDAEAGSPESRFGANDRLRWLPDASRVLVVFPDDAASRLRVQGFVDWKPVMEDEWDFPRLPPTTREGT